MFCVRLTGAVAKCEAVDLSPSNLEKDTLQAQKIDFSSEETRFQVALGNHRKKLAYYKSKWEADNAADSSCKTQVCWPQDIATPEEIPALRTELKFCRRSPNYRDDTMYCQQVQFRIATALLQSPTVKVAAEGLSMIKDLAERGHPDAMCLYGICLCEGKASLDPNPLQGVVWLRRCAELHGHAQSIYELGVAFYTGEGVVEDEGQAVKYFRMSSDDGHPGASYLLGDCLLDGFGTEKDRAEALERFIGAAERGHRGAQSRVLALLERRPGEPSEWFIDRNSSDTLSALSMTKQQEAKELSQDALYRLERRYTIGGEPSDPRRFYFGGPSPPAVIASRKTIVQNSRHV
eukprot:CAMPEP_0172428428 /NCGR_PEP_ID=MMETSP1064-20121228/46273_1 /TAXON_ID=202472 /ORGANISM="Aulacoseira subarctica , Strain CCAP 1002/5" /LENGTH=347 /DNA_ID=CAMNT_0013173201 /DNA_START=241 /DNA_END=1284 /DNA_ORIENTATION=-